jgi:phosphopantothenoylcysteine decarboxylase/phosphopantothenate--cysteine ligase
MTVLAGKHILLGVTGSIAAYKSADLASKLTQSGALVDVILTPFAENFITPITFQSVTGRQAFTDDSLWGGQAHVLHVELGHNADLLMVAPCTSNTLAKLAHGLADNLLTITALAFQGPLLIAPAMDVGMYTAPATQENLRILAQRGASFAGPAEGRMASGLQGKGRMLEPVELLGYARLVLGKKGKLTGRRVVVTAGGTQEPLDPARVLTNRSSGKQGYAVAQSALDEGAAVVLISGPVALDPPVGVDLVRVATAQEMQDAVLKQSAGADALVMAAAVADFRPSVVSKDKIKKAKASTSLDLEPTSDILLSVAGMAGGRPKRVIGFAAESRDLLDQAEQKLAAKKLDMIVANDISAADAGFGVDTNRISLLFPGGKQETLPLMNKAQAAEVIIARLVDLLETG